MLFLFLATICVNMFFEAGAVSWTSTPFSPPSVPLAVRSPYLSVWLPQGAGSALNDQWPQSWTGQDIIGWAGFAKVDGTAYVWMGSPGVPNVTFTKATQKSLQSNFVLTAGPVDLNITFLSPVEPSDLVNQSLPLSYYSISATSNDGKSHNVQIYVDISGEWVGGTRDGVTNQMQYASDIDHISQGSAYHSTLSVTGTTYQTGQDVVVRAQFVNNGILNNTLDTDFPPVVYSVGHARDPAIQYIVINNGRQEQSSYFWSRFSAMTDAIETFLKDYDDALIRADEYDKQINDAASKISSDYASLVALSIRQTFGTIEITAPRQSDGSLDTSKVLTFMKRSIKTVNTVDVIYPSWLLFLYSNTVIARSLIEPLLQYQSTGQYPNAWCVHDMGSNYPNATGHNDGLDTPLPIEESGAMLIMALSYTQWSSDLDLIKTYFDILEQWTQYLVANTLYPANQMSSDVFTGPLANQTNLAIKGIIGIQAMAEMAALTGDSARSANYSSIAATYVQQWRQLATSASGSHLILALLRTNIVPSDVYDMLAHPDCWYNGKADTYGLILDTRNTYTKPDWSIFTAGIVTSTDVRDQIVSAIVMFAADGQNNLPLADWYDVNTGRQEASSANFARPVVGAHLALVPAPNTTFPSSGSTGGPIGPSSSPASPKPRKSGSPATKGYGGVAVITFTLLAVLCTTICLADTML
ncbi:hypothetical protein BD310DRAFT_945106 [Dichomitus squalens]|uniref:DUF1793-domain-containing protein n=1 Tax=Dichomitus squalens TaxID=114155 RepID=A0A4Q9Q8M9_9APHY|nr:hypothetical protein BD310DRAFT_945106 [Dichomitus squalens]